MKMNFVSIFIDRPVLTTVVSIVIVLFGIIGFSYLGVREFPSVDPPVVTVRTDYVGANSDIMESQVTEVLEEAINGIAGIESISSISTDGRSTITVEFSLEIDMEAAANDVRDRVSGAIRRLPPDIDPPVVQKEDADGFPIISMTISSPNRSLLELSDIATNLFKERLQTIPGVSRINIWGDKKYAMKLLIDPARMASYGLTPGDLRDALNRENIELPTGRIEGFGQELTIRTLGRLVTPAEFEDLIIREQDGVVVRMKDIGTAELRAENERGILRGDYTFPQVAVALSPQPGSNHIEIADEFAKRVEKIKLEAPDDLNYNIVIDSTAPIRTAIKEVKDTILLAFLLVVIVIFFFLRAWRTTLIPVIAIPISLIGSFFVMYIMGYTINILTLLGVVLATGLVVDDAIVMMENIYAKIEKGMNPIEAGYKGTQEIVFAIISTTITLTAVFLPIIFLQGLTGRLFREFGIVVAGAVIISTIVSLTLTPMMSAHLLKKSTSQNRFFEWSEKQFNRLGSAYERSLTSFMGRKWLALIIMAISFVGIYVIGSNIPSELAPLEDKSALTVNATAPEGVSYELMDEYMMEIMRVLDEFPEKKTALTVTAPSFGSNTAVNTGFARVALVTPDKRDKSQQQIADEIAAEMKKRTFAKVFVGQQQTIGGDRRGGLPLQYVIQAPNFEKLKEKIPEFMEQANASGAFSVIDLNLKFNKPELTVEIDRERARALGVTVSDIAETLQLYFSGQRFGFFIMNGKQYQVIGQASRDNRDEPIDLQSVNVRNNRGELVQLDNLVTLSELSSPPQLFRYNRYVSATVSAQPADGYTLGQGIDEMDKIAAAVLDDSFTSTLSGAAKEFRESSNSLMFAFLLSLVLVYLVLAAQFESFVDPLIIMFTVPLALTGAVLVLWMFGQTLNIFSQIGIIVLTGIVTKNGILIVEFANQIKDKGASVSDSVIQAASQRFRPILMTSMATVLGALPIALALGAASKSRVPMGSVIIGGLLFSLILTLYIIPALYAYLSGKGIKKLMKRSSAGAAVLLLASTPLFAQEKLTLDAAIAEGLKNNYNIIIAKGAADIASNNNTLGNAGFLPTLDAQAGINEASTNSRLVFFDGREQEARGAASDAINAAVLFNWTLFDGTRMFITKNKLAELEVQGEMQARMIIENTVSDIIVQYYTIAQLEKFVLVIENALKLSEDRLKIAEQQLELGSGSELALLQSKVDRNADQSNLLQQRAALVRAKATLNQLLARQPDLDFEVETNISFDTNLSYADLLVKLENQNPQLLAARASVRVAEQEVKEFKSNHSPRLDFFTNYNYGRSQNEVGILQSNRSTGLTYGLTATFNIFNGFNTSRAVKNSKIQVLMTQAELDIQQQSMHTDLYTSFADYTANVQLANLEAENLAVAKQNVEVALESYRLGGISDFELRETQLKLMDAESRLLMAQFSAKAAEVELFRLTGSLGK
jgi:multidrug efflux pump